MILPVLSFLSFAILIFGWQKNTFVSRFMSVLALDGIGKSELTAKVDKIRIPYEVIWKGDIESGELRESSGLAYSTRSESLLWSINDSGSGAEIFALSEKGSHLGKWELKGLDGLLI